MSSASGVSRCQALYSAMTSAVVSIGNGLPSLSLMRSDFVAERATLSSGDDGA